MEDRKLIKVQNAVLTYHQIQPVHALHNVSLSIEKGEWVSILGPSGSGKTTLLKVIGGMERLTSGNVEVNGRSLSNFSDNELQQYRREIIGFVFQQYRLFEQYSVLENVMIPQWPYQAKKLLQEKATILLKKVGMSERMHHLPGELSGGEKQRTAIARALLNEPPILLCDEPTGNLDAENRENIMYILKQLHEQGITILLVTHDMEVTKYGDRELYIRDGTLKEQVTS